MWGLSALILSTAAALAAGQDPVPAQPNPETPPTQVMPVTSAPTALDPAESTGAVASVKAKFDALDSNHDGLIDQGEAAGSDTLLSQFATLDSSADGKLTLAEFTAASNLASIRIDHPGRRK
jgi:hypothetical protein